MVDLGLEGLNPELRAAVATALVGRYQLGRAMGLTFNDTRDLGATFGYKQQLTVADYCQRYERGGIAARCVTTMAKATWRGGVELVEDGDPERETPFEKAWRGICKPGRLNVVRRLFQADALSQLSYYSVLLIGDGRPLDEELSRGNKTGDGILFLQSYLGASGPVGSRGERPITPSMALEALGSGGSALIREMERRPTEKRFGRPNFYELRNNDGLQDPGFDRPVHHSRIIHAADAERALYNDLFAEPILKAPWNYLDDLDKVVGGGAEAFYQRANQGRVWSIDKDITGLSDKEKEEFRDQIEEFRNNTRRDVRARGLTLDTTSSDVADFSGPQDALTKLIAATLGLPQRILTGSEMGELASSQDRDNFRDQVNGRREQHAGPNLLMALANRLIEYGHLPEPAEEIEERWGAVMNLTEEEKQSKLTAWCGAKTDEGPVFTNAEIRDNCYEMDPMDEEQLAAIQAAREQKARAAALARPQAPPALRAAAGDEEIVRILEEAIAGGEDGVVQALVAAAYNPDQPRDEEGRWTEVGAAEAGVKEITARLTGGKRRVVNVDHLRRATAEDLGKLRVHYETLAAGRREFAERLSAKAALQAVVSELEGRK